MLNAMLMTSPGRRTHVARVNTVSECARAMRHLLARVGFVRKRRGSEVEWHVHRDAAGAAKEFVRRAPAGTV